MLGHLDKKFYGGWVGGGGGGIAIIVTSSRLQVTLRVETCVELELSLPESDLEPSLLIIFEIQNLTCRFIKEST